MPPHNTAGNLAALPREEMCLAPLDDLQIARAAAAQANAEQGYPMLAQPYLDGAWDNDTEVRSALIAIRLARQAESFTIQPRDEEHANNVPSTDK